jgi:hypothetical protein
MHSFYKDIKFIIGMMTMAYYTCIGIKYSNKFSWKQNDLDNYVTNYINLILQQWPNVSLLPY